jgi:hypothetical protein
MKSEVAGGHVTCKEEMFSSEKRVGKCRFRDLSVDERIMLK